MKPIQASRQASRPEMRWPSVSMKVWSTLPLEHIAEGYHIFSAKLDDCIKPVIVPSAA